MKIFVFSDLHGNAQVLDTILQSITKEQPNKVVFCGDLFGGHTSANIICQALKQIDAVLYVVRGNNDFFYNADCDFEEYAVMHHFERTLFFTHGHVYHGYKFPSFLGKDDVLIHGHTHRTHFYKNNGVHVLNVGSCAQPRDGRPCYVILDDQGATQKDLEGNVIFQYEWN